MPTQVYGTQERATEVNYPFFDVGVYFVRGGGREGCGCLYILAKCQGTGHKNAKGPTL